MSAADLTQGDLRILRHVHVHGPIVGSVLRKRFGTFSYRRTWLVEDGWLDALPLPAKAFNYTVTGQTLAHLARLDQPKDAREIAQPRTINVWALDTHTGQPWTIHRPGATDASQIASHGLKARA